MIIVHSMQLDASTTAAIGQLADNSDITIIILTIVLALLIIDLARRLLMPSRF